jgi:adenylate cyclase
VRNRLQELVQPDDSTTPLQVHEGGGKPILAGDLVSWVINQGRSLYSMAELFDQFCWRLVGNDVPLWRATLHGFTLHPQMRGVGLRWWRDQNLIEEFAVNHGAESHQDFTESPLHATVLDGRVERFPPGDPGWQDLPLLRRLATLGATEYLALPLGQFNARFITATFATDAPSGFDVEHTARVEAAAPALGAVVEGLLLKRMVANLLNTYLGREAGPRVLSGEILRGQGTRLRAVIMATDLRGFTRLSDQLPPGDIIEVLNDYFECVSSAVRAQGGDVLKFIGDGVLSIFRVDGHDEVDAATRALSAARATLAGLDELNRNRAWAERPILKAGVGLHIGDVIYGNVGALDRLDFTVIGPAVNLAFRLESLTKILGTPLLTSKAFADDAPGHLESLGFQPVRGLDEPVEVFGWPNRSYAPRTLSPAVDELRFSS